MPAPDARAPWAAVGLLTRVPVGGPAASADALVAGAPLFPLVGAAIGAAVGGAAIAAELVLPALMAGAVAVAVELALTGALHLDGLADSADGLAGRDRDHALAIMRDHSLGAYGGAALALDLLLKAVALGALARDGSVLPIVAAFALSRAAPLQLAAVLPYARPDEGTGRLLTERSSLAMAAGSLIIASVLALAAVRVDAIAMLGCLAATTAMVGVAAKCRIGGVTGDVLGAAAEITATLALIVAIALRS